MDLNQLTFKKIFQNY